MTKRLEVTRAPSHSPKHEAAVDLLHVYIDSVSRDACLFGDQIALERERGNVAAALYAAGAREAAYAILWLLREQLRNLS